MARATVTDSGSRDKTLDYDQKLIWGTPEFYRVFSLVNGGRTQETDLFQGRR